LTKKYFYIGLLALFAFWLLPSCKAKSCDASSGVVDVKGSKKPRKNIGLLSKKERRKRKW